VPGPGSTPVGRVGRGLPPGAGNTGGRYAVSQDRGARGVYVLARRRACVSRTARAAEARGRVRRSGVARERGRGRATGRAFL